jgi:hypothetical protein
MLRTILEENWMMLREKLEAARGLLRQTISSEEQLEPTKAKNASLSITCTRGMQPLSILAMTEVGVI